MASSATISIGDVFLLKCTLCNPVKMKYFLVVLADPLKMLVINSKASEFQLRTPSIRAALVPMYVSEHPFMAHDSVIGCHQVWHEYSLDQLTHHLASNPSAYCGHLSNRAKALVRDALRISEHIPKKWLRELQPHWGW